MKRPIDEPSPCSRQRIKQIQNRAYHRLRLRLNENLPIKPVRTKRPELRAA